MNTSVIIAENKYKQKIAFYCDEHIGKAILHHGIYDRHGLLYIEKILSALNNPIVFDIGTNIGNHALAMSKHSEMIYLFEPQKNIVTLLHKTMSLNNIRNWKIFDFGLAEQEKTLPLYKNLDGNNGASTFIPELKGQQFSTEELHVYAGDDIVNKHAIPRIDFIKIDVEGFEGNVIAGLKNSIKKFLPIVIIEWNNESTKKQFKEYNLFNDVFSNYLVKAITNNHHKSRWHNKWLGKIRRFFYKSFTKKRWITGDFIESFNYPHVLLVPKEKESILLSL